MWVINEEGLPGTGQVSQEALAELLDLAVLSLGAYQQGTLVGFVICLPPGTRYGSPNYAWFNTKLDTFIYVDRIAVSKSTETKASVRCCISKSFPLQRTTAYRWQPKSIRNLPIQGPCGSITDLVSKKSAFLTMLRNR